MYPYSSTPNVSRASRYALQRSRQTLLQKQQRQPVGTILNGELRFASKNHFDSFARFASGFATHIVTYQAFEQLAYDLVSADRVKIVEQLKLAPGSGSAWHQWYTLPIALRWFRFVPDYETILRLRTDTTLPPALPTPLPGTHSPTHIIGRENKFWV